jgi:translation initiation factor IF-2
MPVRMDAPSRIPARAGGGQSERRLARRPALEPWPETRYQANRRPESDTLAECVTLPTTPRIRLAAAGAAIAAARREATGAAPRPARGKPKAAAPRPASGKPKGAPRPASGKPPRPASLRSSHPATTAGARPGPSGARPALTGKAAGTDGRVRGTARPGARAARAQYAGFPLRQASRFRCTRLVSSRPGTAARPARAGAPPPPAGLDPQGPPRPARTPHRAGRAAGRLNLAAPPVPAITARTPADTRCSRSAIPPRM